MLGTMADFSKNPGGSAARPVTPRDFTKGDPSKLSQKSGSDPTDDKSKPAGPSTAAEVVTPSADAGNPIGAGSLKSGNKPFRV